MTVLIYIYIYIYIKSRLFFFFLSFLEGGFSTNLLFLCFPSLFAEIIATVGGQVESYSHFLFPMTEGRKVISKRHWSIFDNEYLKKFEFPFIFPRNSTTFSPLAIDLSLWNTNFFFSLNHYNLVVWSFWTRFVRLNIRTFTSIYSKIYVYFSIIIYFFIYLTTFSKHSHQIIYSNIYFIKILFF